jgi:hypothetical protein
VFVYLPHDGDGFSTSVTSSTCSCIGSVATTFASITTTAVRTTEVAAVVTSMPYHVTTSTTTGSSRNFITRFREMDQIKKRLLSGYLPVIVLILQTFVYVGQALALGIVPASASPVVVFRQVLHMYWQGKGELSTGSDFHATLDHQYATGILFLSLGPSPRLFNTTKCWQGPYICPLQPYQLRKVSSAISSRNTVYSSHNYLNHYIELLNLSCKKASLTSSPLSQTVEVHHYTTASMRRFNQFNSIAHNQPLTFLLSVCPYNTVGTSHHSKIFVSTCSKTLRHEGKVLAMTPATESLRGTSTFHYFTQQYPPSLQSCLLLPYVAARADRHSNTSFIYDGALAMLVQPRFTLWKIM